jgi:copper chaperone CopZ
MTVVKLAVKGVSCERCEDKVTRILRAVPGVHDVSYDLATSIATVITHDSHDNNDTSHIPAIAASAALGLAGGNYKFSKIPKNSQKTFVVFS